MKGLKTSKINVYTCTDGKQYLGSGQKANAEMHQKGINILQEEFNNEMAIAKILGLDTNEIYGDDVSANNLEVKAWVGLDKYIEDVIQAIDTDDIYGLRSLAESFCEFVDVIGGIDKATKLYYAVAIKMD